MPGGQVSLRSLELSSPDSVEAFGKTLIGEGRPVHLLINNAGVMTPADRQTTAERFELQFGTNHLGRFALVAHLLPLLRAGQARVTSQVSIAANQNAINWDDLNWERSYNGQGLQPVEDRVGALRSGTQPAQRKRPLGHHQQHLSPWRRADKPAGGPAGGGAGQEHPGCPCDRFLSARGILLGTVESAKFPALYAATSPDARPGRFYGPSGLFHLGGPPAEQKLYSRFTSTQEAARVRQTSEQLTGLSLKA